MAAATPSQPAGPAAKGSILWAQGLACGALLTFAAPTALLLAILLAPAIACALGEKNTAGSSTRAVGLCCAAAALSPVWHLWMRGDAMDAALDALANPLVLVTAWGAGACAWALCQVVPVVLRTAWDASEAARARVMQAELARTREEWDIPPNARIAAQEPG